MAIREALKRFKTMVSVLVSYDLNGNILVDGAGLPYGNVQTGGGSTWAYGDYPQNLTAPYTGTVAGVNAGDVIGEFDVEGYSQFSIQNNHGTAALAVTVSIDGTNFSDDCSLILHDGGATYVTAVPAGDIGFYNPPGKIKRIRLVQSGATAFNDETLAVMRAGVK